MKIIELIIIGIFVFVWFLFVLYFIKFRQFVNKIKRHPLIYKKFLKTNKIWAFSLAPRIYVGFFSGNKFDRIFDKFYYYEDIKRTGDKELINFANNYKKFVRFFGKLFILILLFLIIAFFIVLFIIALIFGGIR